MLIIGCDFHPGFEEVAIFDDETGEMRCQHLGHVEEARQFYGSVAGPVCEGRSINLVRCVHAFRTDFQNPFLFCTIQFNTERLF